jgi:hypothetical protein
MWSSYTERTTVPYYDTIFPGTAIPSGNRVTNSVGFVSQNFEDSFSVLDVRDRSFRTHPHKVGQSKEVPTNVAEPYTWFSSVQDMYRRNALQSGFDASVFHEDTGHPWEFERKQVVGKMWDFSYVNPFNNATFQFWGGWPSANISGIQAGFYTPSSELESWAALMYGRMAPTGSQFSFSAFTGELREGLPRLLPSNTKSVVKALRGIGDDYLNVKFGWEPLLNDLRTLAQGLLEASYGLYRPFGAVRRNRNQRPITSRDTASALNYSPPVSTATVGGASWTRGNLRLARYSSVHRWIEGEFVYIPKAGFDPSKYMDRLETLMSFDITPSVLWQLTPWSWLVDWFADIGGALQSAEAATNNRILSTFCYAMEETKTYVSVNYNDIRGDGAQYMGPASLSQSWQYTRKRRVRANPFGYTGSPSTTLQSDQMAILAALGLSRSKN